MSTTTANILEAMRRDTERGLKAMKLRRHPAGEALLRDQDELIAEVKVEAEK